MAKRILAVENNELVLSFLEAGLEAAGYDVDTARNGREALDKIDCRGYDLIISDIKMPEVNGLELFRELEARRSSSVRRLLLLTGPDAMSEHASFFAETGARAITKPVALEALRLTVEEMIDGPEQTAA